MASPDYYRTAFLADATGQSNGTGYTTDESRHSHTLTYNGNAQILSGKFELDGVGDFISIPQSILWVPGSKFTLIIKGLVFDVVNTGISQGVVSHYSADGGEISWNLSEVSGTLRFGWSNTGGSTTHTVDVSTVSAGVEYDVALVWDGSTVYSFLNGVQGGSLAFSDIFASSSQPLRLGANANASVADSFLDGRFAAVLLTRGEALFPVGVDAEMPSLPLTTQTPSMADPFWEDVVYLVAHDEALGRPRDFGPLDLRIVPSGNVAGNAAGSVSGSDSTIDFDGAGDFYSISDSPFTRIVDGEDFCLDAVIKTTDLSHTNTVTNKRGGATARDVSLSIANTGVMTLSAWNSSNTSVLLVQTAAGAIASSTDYHVAASLQGTSGRVFVNGALSGAATKSGTIANTSDALRLGRDNSNTSRDFEGQWAWHRRTKGSARYTAAFTAPTGALPNGPSSIPINVDPGSYTIAGTAASLRVARLLTAMPASYTHTGTPASLRAGYKLAAVTGSYTLSGAATDLTVTRRLVAAVGAYNLTGQSVTFTVAKGISIVPGSYTLSGVAATLRIARTVSAASGVYSLSGQAATLTYVRRLMAASGSYALTGESAELTYTPVSRPPLDIESRRLTVPAMSRDQTVGASVRSLVISVIPRVAVVDGNRRIV